MAVWQRQLLQDERLRRVGASNFGTSLSRGSHRSTTFEQVFSFSLRFYQAVISCELAACTRQSENICTKYLHAHEHSHGAALYCNRPSLQPNQLCGCSPCRNWEQLFPTYLLPARHGKVMQVSLELPSSLFGRGLGTCASSLPPRLAHTVWECFPSGIAGMMHAPQAREHMHHHPLRCSVH